MTAGQRVAVDLDRVLAPDREHVAVMAADEAVLPPQREQRGGHLLTPRGGRVVVGQVDGGGGAVVLAGAVDRGRVAEAPQVLVHGLRVERLAAAAQGAQPAADPAVGVVAEHLLGERLRLGEEEPVPVAEAEFSVGVLEGVPGRDDVQYREPGDRVLVVERHPVTDPGSAVVTRHGELVEAQIAHHHDLVPRHRALAVGLMARAAGGLAAVAVAAQVGQDNGVVFGEYGGHVMPHDVGLRVAVQQQHGTAGAADQRVDADAAGCEGSSLKHAGQRNGHGCLIPAAKVT
jgi:hypothetical protein